MRIGEITMRIHQTGLTVATGMTMLLGCIFFAMLCVMANAQNDMELRSAQKLCEEKKFQEASNALEKICKQEPAFADAHCLLGYAYLQLGRQDDARKALAQAVAYGRLTPDVLERIAQIDRQQNQIAPLLTALRLRMLIEPKSKEWNLFYADVLAYAGGWEEAGQIYRKMIEADRSRAELFSRSSNVYVRQGEYRKAAIALETAYYLGDTDPKLSETLASLWDNAGDWPRAIFWYERMFQSRKNPEKRLLLRRVELLLEIEQYVQAEDAIRSLAKSEDKDVAARALFLSGQIAMRRNQPEIALSHWENAIRSGNADPKILAFLGSHYFNEGRYEKATEYLGKRLALGTEDKSLLRYLILSLIRSGQKDRARNEIKIYVEHYGWDEEANRLISFLTSNVKDEGK